MTCVICKRGQTEAGTTTVTLEQDGLTLVVKGVPAQVCGNCGEAYVTEGVTETLLKAASEASLKGAQVDVRRYIAA